MPTAGTIESCDPGEVVAGMPPPASVEISGTDEPCTIVNVWTPTVIVPVRRAPVFGATSYETLPLPVPEEPDVMEIHATLLTAVHAHPEVAVTGIVPEVPAAIAVTEDGLKLATQPVVKDHTDETKAPTVFLAPIAQL